MSIYRVALHGTFNSDDVVNVWHFSAANGLESDINTDFSTLVAADYLACLHSSYSFVDITTTNLTTLAQDALALTGTGGHTLSEGLPPQVAAVISWKTAKVGRAYRGRTYIGGLAEDSNNAGLLAGAVGAQLVTLADDIMTDWPGGFGGTFVIYHRGSSTFDAVTSFTVRNTLYTQRRRAVGVGS